MAVAKISNDLSEEDLDLMVQNAAEASEFLKTLGQESRLLILCALMRGERSVTELEEFLGARQAAVSQQLAKLRLQGMVKTRRDGKTIYYSVSDDRARQAIDLVYNLFCVPAPRRR